MIRPSPAVLVVGSGPAGVWAARGLLERGIPVLMVDAGSGAAVTADPRRPSVTELRADGRQGRAMLGRGLAALDVLDDRSPKLRTCAPPGFADGYAEDNRLTTRAFRLIGALASGGLSNLWGAVASTFDGMDTASWPVGAAALPYAEVAAEIGISGCADDMDAVHGTGLPMQPAPELSPSAAALLAAYERRRPPALTLGRARQAVLTAAHDGRDGCDLCLGCMWGCPRRAIYNSGHDLERLRRHPLFEFRPGVRVDGIDRAAERGYCVRCTTSRGAETIAATTVVLAAGTVASTRLVWEMDGAWDRESRLLNNPLNTFAVWHPRRLGAALPTRAFGMVELSFRLAGDDPGDYAIGQIYEAQAFAAADLMRAMPLTRPGAARLMRTLLPGLQVGLLYYSGEHSDNRVRLVRAADGRGELRIDGGVAGGFAAVERAARRRLSRGLLALGGIPLPGSFTRMSPGAEVHYAGTLPMGTATGADGEVAHAPGLFVADGAVLPTLPAKHVTFTIMANALRIGRLAAERVGG